MQPIQITETAKINIDQTYYINKQEEKVVNIEKTRPSKVAWRKFLAENQPVVAALTDKKGPPHKIKYIYEDVVGWARPIAYIWLDDDSVYYFTDLYYQADLDNSPLREGSTVYLYPMLSEEVYRDPHDKFHKARYWLEDEKGNRWRVW